MTCWSVWQLARALPARAAHPAGRVHAAGHATPHAAGDHAPHAFHAAKALAPAAKWVATLACAGGIGAAGLGLLPPPGRASPGATPRQAGAPAPDQGTNRHLTPDQGTTPPPPGPGTGAPIGNAGLAALDFDARPAPVRVPEPGSLLPFAAGLAALAALRRARA